MVITLHSINKLLFMIVDCRLYLLYVFNYVLDNSLNPFI